MPSCASCNAAGDRLLGCPCEKVQYCNATCQRSHWKEHKPQCPPYLVKSIQGKGMGLVAVRKLKAGTLLIEEKPLISIPDSSNDDCDLRKYSRAVLQQFERLSPTDRATVLQLSDPGLERNNPYEMELEAVCKSLTSSEESMKAVRIFSANHIGGCGEEFESGINVSRLYPTIARINHACSPNVVWGWKMADTKVKQVRTIRNIEKGEELVASYLDDHMFSTREVRQSELQNRWKFTCTCQICSLEGKELRESDARRNKIQKLRETFDRSRMAFYQQADRNKPPPPPTDKDLSLSKKMLNLMLEIRDEMLVQLPSVYLHCYRLCCILSIISREKNNYLEDATQYKAHALELSKAFGEMYINDYVQVVRDCEMTLARYSGH